MNWNKIFTTIAYVSAAAATTIVTAGIALPVWVMPALAITGTVSGKLAASHVNSVNEAAAIAAAAGAAAKAASDSTRRG